jgi:hypothetical protein
MPQPSLSDEEALKAVEAYNLHGNNQCAAADALNLSRGAFQNRLRIAARRGLHLSKGAQEAMIATRLSGVEIAGGYRHVYDNDGKKTETVRWSVPKSEIQLDEALDRIREKFDGLAPAEPVRPPDTSDSDMLGFFPHADMHTGMVINADQGGGREYNQRIAVERFKAGVSECIAGTPPCAKALIVNAGDAMHANDDTDRTPRSGHKLKVEGTHHQNLGICIEVNAFAIDLALQRHATVEYRAIGGNHDPNAPAPILYALRERYRNEPRVNVVVTEDEFWQMNWGRVFLAGHHGHNRKPKDVCAELPGKYPKVWGAAKEWHYFSAHYHNYQSVKYGPTRHHQLPAVCSMDTHSAWAPYSGEAGMMAMTFHKKYGLKNTLYVGL